MNKLNQEDICPCGSGREYGSCCAGKDVLDFHHTDNHWEKEEIEELSTEVIISRLKYYGVDFVKDKFIKQCRQFGSAEEVSELWFDEYNINLSGFDDDFLWLAALILGNRILNKDFILDEELGKLIQLGYEYIENDNLKKGCDVWLEGWKKFKEKTNYTEQYDSIEIMNQDCKADMFMQNWINDMDMNLQHAGEDYGEDYWQKKLEFCREVYQKFPQSTESILKTIKKGEALAYFGIGEMEKGEKSFKNLLEEYSDWPWGYVYWADVYNPYISWNILTDDEKAYELYEKANQLNQQKEGEDLSVVEERMMDFPQNDITEKEDNSFEIIFHKENYLEFCEHNDILVQQWAYKQLTRHFPESNEALNYTFELIVDDVETLKFDIYKFLEDQAEYISEEKVFTFVQNNNDKISQKTLAHLLKFLANKQYQVDKIIEMILEMFKNDITGQIYQILQKALVNLQNDKAYKLLKSMGSEIKINSWLLGSYFRSLLTFKKNKDIKNITEQVLSNLDKVDYQHVFYDLSELYFGCEYIRRMNDFYYTNDLEEILDYLQDDWPNNSAVQSLISLLDEQLITDYNNQKNETVFNTLVNKIKTILLEKYQLSILEDFQEINLKQLQKKEAALSLEDYWITYLASQISSHSDEILLKEAEEYFIYLLISMLIALKEDIGFDNIVKQAQEDDELLWEILTLEREQIPEQIVEIVKKQGKKYEKKALKFIKDNEYHLALPRVLSYLGSINSNQAVPDIISLVHEDQGDFICEAVEDALINIDNISLGVVYKKMYQGDEVTRLYTSAVLEENPCEDSAEILIDFHKQGLFNYHEAFVEMLKDIGAVAGLEYLDETEFTHRPPNLDETLYILSVIHDKKVKIMKYQRKLKRKNKKNKKRTNNRVQGHSPAQLKEEYIQTEDGTIIRRQDVGRNDPCPCGSGKKYKKCCGR